MQPTDARTQGSCARDGCQQEETQNEQQGFRQPTENFPYQDAHRPILPVKWSANESVGQTLNNQIRVLAHPALSV